MKIKEYDRFLQVVIGLAFYVTKSKKYGSDLCDEEAWFIDDHEYGEGEIEFERVDNIIKANIIFYDYDV